MSSLHPCQQGTSRVLELCYSELKLWDFVRNQKLLVSSNKTLACCWMHESACVLTLEHQVDNNTEGHSSLYLCLRDAKPVDIPSEWIILEKMNVNHFMRNIEEGDTKVSLSTGHVRCGIKEDEQYVLVSFQGCPISSLIKITKGRNESFNPSRSSRMTKKKSLISGSISLVGELDMQWSMISQNSGVYEFDTVQAIWKMGDYDYEINDVSDDRLITSFHGAICIWSLKRTPQSHAKDGDESHIDFTLVEQLRHSDIIELINKYNKKNELSTSSSNLDFILSHLCTLSNQIFALVHDFHSVHVLHIDFMKYCFHSLTSLKDTVSLLLSRQICKKSKTLYRYNTKYDNQALGEHFTALEVVQHRDGNSVQLIVASNEGNVKIYDMNSKQFLDQNDQSENQAKNSNSISNIHDGNKVSFPLLIKSSTPSEFYTGETRVENDRSPLFKGGNTHDKAAEKKDRTVSFAASPPTSRRSVGHCELSEMEEEYRMRELAMPYLIVDSITCLTNYKKVVPYFSSNNKHHHEHLYTVLLSSSSSSSSSLSLVCSDSAQVVLLPSGNVVGHATYCHRSIKSMALSSSLHHPQSCLNTVIKTMPSPSSSSSAPSSFHGAADAEHSSCILIATSSNHYDQIITLSLLDLNKTQVGTSACSSISPLPVATIDVSTSLSPLMHSHFAMLQLQDQYGDEKLIDEQRDNHSLGCVKVTAMVFSPDGKTLACGDNVGDVRIYELHERSVKDIGEQLRSGGNEESIRMEAELVHHCRTSTSFVTPTSSPNLTSTLHQPHAVASLSWCGNDLQCRHLLISLTNGKSLLALKAKGYNGGYCLQESWDHVTVKAAVSSARESCNISSNHSLSDDEDVSNLYENLAHSFLAKHTSSPSSDVKGDSGLKTTNPFLENDSCLYAYSASMTCLNDKLHCYIARHHIASRQKHVSPTNHHHGSKSVPSSEADTHHHSKTKPIQLGSRWQSVTSPSSLSVFKLDSPCTGLTRHPFAPYLIATTLKGTVVVYHMFTKELRGVFSTKSGGSITTFLSQNSTLLYLKSCFRYPQIDPSGIYVALASTKEAKQGENEEEEVEGKRRNLNSTSTKLWSQTSYVEIYQIFTGRKEARLTLEGTEITSIRWSYLKRNIMNIDDLPHNGDDENNPGVSSSEYLRESSAVISLVVGTSNAGLKVLKIPQKVQLNMIHMAEESIKSPFIWDTCALYIPPLPKTVTDFRSLLVDPSSNKHAEQREQGGDNMNNFSATSMKTTQESTINHETGF